MQKIVHGCVQNLEHRKKLTKGKNQSKMCKRVAEIHHKIKTKKQMDNKGNYILVFINIQANRTIIRYCSHNKWLKVVLASVCENKKQQSPYAMKNGVKLLQSLVDSLELIILKRYLPISSNSTNVCGPGNMFRRVYYTPRLEITLIS